MTLQYGGKAFKKYKGMENLLLQLKPSSSRNAEEVDLKTVYK
jgi:hypothetical protein